MSKKEYRAECEKRWYGVALSDALYNFEQWEEMREYLVDVMRQYRHNTGQVDMSGKYHNPDHSLRGFLWNCQAALQSDHSRLNPFLDFEEHYQKIFLRRGLLIYCGGILDGLKAECATLPGQTTFTFNVHTEET